MLEIVKVTIVSLGAATLTASLLGLTAIPVTGALVTVTLSLPNPAPTLAPPGAVPVALTLSRPFPVCAATNVTVCGALPPSLRLTDPVGGWQGASVGLGQLTTTIEAAICAVPLFVLVFWTVNWYLPVSPLTTL